MIRLNLQRHCIETELKRLHRRWVDRLLKADTDSAEAEKILIEAPNDCLELMINHQTIDLSCYYKSKTPSADR